MPHYQNDNCPVCSSSNLLILGNIKNQDDFVIKAPDNTKIVECKKCGLLYVTPLPFWTQDDFQYMYGSDYFSGIDQKWLDKRKNSMPIRRLSHIKKHLSSDSKSVLELGGGEFAFMAQFLKKDGWYAAVQEPSKQFIDKLNGLNFDDVINTPILEMDTDRKYSRLFCPG